MSDVAKHPGGRPSLYDPAYCERVIELGNEGASIDEMAYELGVHDNTLRNWAEVHPEFLDAFTRGQQASQVWWERKGRSNLENTQFKDGMWSRNMSARFPSKWREVKTNEHSGPNGGAIPFKGWDISFGS